MAGQAAADDPILVPPIDCGWDEGCYVQQYVDTDPGPGRSDFMCGPLANDGHVGTDFALPSLAMMAAGVPVRAPASGIVSAVRDGMPDIARDAPNAPAIGGRDCGNGVVIDHGDGWETQVCHLRNGSVAVNPGQSVGTASVLGNVGLSGATTFPHVHLSVRRNGRVVDPFDPEGTGGCGASGRTLWADAIPYRPGGVIAVGFTDRVPDYAEVKAGTASTRAVPPDGALVTWAFVFGTRAGDVLKLSVAGPRGSVLSEDITLDRRQALAFRAVGRRRPEGGWPAGPYTARAEMVRGGASLGSRLAAVTVR